MTTMRTSLALACMLLLWAGAAAGQANQAPAPLPAWEQLTPAQRDSLIAPVRERWDGNPEERAAMLERAHRWQQLPAPDRSRIHRGMHRWEHMQPSERAQMQRLFELTRDMPRDQRKVTFALFRKMRTLPPAEREALRKQWPTLSAQQQQEWLRKNSPRHGRRDRDHVPDPGYRLNR